MKKIVLCFLSGVFFFSSSVAFGSVRSLTDSVDITLGGQLRPRFEVNNKGLNNADKPNYFTTMRSRLNIGVEAKGSFKAFFQLQDVRAWGEETNTLNDYDADGFDLHQAYADLINPLDMPFTLRVGRQEIILEGHRLMGNVNWTQRARAFDAVKLMADHGQLKINLFASKLKEGTKGTDKSIAAKTVTGTSNETWNKRDDNLYGLWTKLKLTDKTGLSYYLLYQDLENTDNNVDNAVDRYTTGFRLAGASGGLQFRGEGYYQFGNDAGKKIQAYMYGLRLGYTCTCDDSHLKPNVTLWYDYLSGDEKTTDNRSKSFNTLYATNHKFYGFMDYFLNNSGDTDSRGLQDIALKISIHPVDKVKVALDLHQFLLAERNVTAPGDNSRNLGQEVDLTVKWKYSKLINISTGYSIFANAEMDRRGGFDGTEVNNAHWGYVMMDLKF